MLIQESMWLYAREAAALLEVSVPTLYAYVSRGFIRSEASSGSSRARRYAREDVERLRRRKEERRDPGQAVRGALHWGVPVLESSITLISGGRFYYRGHDAALLARTRTLAEVAALVWTGDFEADLLWTPPSSVGRGQPTADLSIVARCQSMLPLAAARDPLAFDLRPRPVAQCGARILGLLTSLASGSTERGATLDATLARHWAPRERHAADLIRAALILAADHELNVSSITARCVASAGSNPYAVVLAGLAAIEGVKHGGVSARVETLWDDLARARDLRVRLADRLRRGLGIEGFGHPLYPQGDPRATVILDLLGERYPRSRELAFARSFAAAALALLGERPTIDFALVALARTLRLRPGAPLALFAIGRTIGWIGHALEQYAQDAIIRPRARYIGRPVAASPA
jgi:citrate synthase